MGFTEAEKAAWHAARREHVEGADADDLPGAGVCAHCGHPLPAGAGDQDFPLCGACDED